MMYLIINWHTRYINCTNRFMFPLCYVKFLITFYLNRIIWDTTVRLLFFAKRKKMYSTPSLLNTSVNRTKVWIKSRISFNEIENQTAKDGCAKNCFHLNGSMCKVVRVKRVLGEQKLLDKETIQNTPQRTILDSLRSSCQLDLK